MCARSVLNVGRFRGLAIVVVVAALLPRGLFSQPTNQPTDQPSSPAAPSVPVTRARVCATRQASLSRARARVWGAGPRMEEDNKDRCTHDAASTSWPHVPIRTGFFLM